MPSANVDPHLFRRPLPLITIALAAGILLAGTFGAHETYLVLVLLLITLSSAVVAVATKRPRWTLVTLILLAATLGYLRFRAQDAVTPNDVSRLAPADVQLTGMVDSEVQEMYAGTGARTTRARFTLRVKNAMTKADEQILEGVAGCVEVSLPVLVSRQGGRGEPPRYGDELWVEGHLELPAAPRNPGGFDERTTLATHGIYSRLTVALPETWSILKTSGSDSGVLKPIYALKELVLSHGRRALSRERAGVLNAILLGSKSEISPADRAAFERTGTVHLLATAGLHTGLVVAMLLYLLPFAGISRRGVVLLTLIFLAIFTTMAGDRPAVMRAAIMASVYLVGMLLEREPDISNAIALAGLGLLLANPFNLFDFGFQISFATVITLSLAMKLTLPLHQRETSRSGRHTGAANAYHVAANYLTTCLFVTVVAQIGSMPLIIYYFNLFTPVGLLANLLIVPTVAPLMALGFAAPVIGAISLAPFLSLPLDWLLNIVTEYILAVVRWCSGPQFEVTSIGSPPVWLLIAYYTALWSWLGWRRVRSKGRGRASMRSGGHGFGGL